MIVGATEQSVATADDVMSCLDLGSGGRQIGTTNMNEHSSRSHTIFTLYIGEEIIISLSIYMFYCLMKGSIELYCYGFITFISTEQKPLVEDELEIVRKSNATGKPACSASKRAFSSLIRQYP